jgi:hypothetical protein
MSDIFFCQTGHQVNCSSKFFNRDHAVTSHVKLFEHLFDFLIGDDDTFEFREELTEFNEV